MRNSMTAIITIAALASLTLTGTACENRSTAGQHPATSHAESAQPAQAHAHAHATHGAQPGSHEDWCGAHQVAESLCTRCNPSLSAAFKATDDWCQEHGLPESQCLICNPDLKIVRPPGAGETSP